MPGIQTTGTNARQILRKDSSMQNGSAETNLIDDDFIDLLEQARDGACVVRNLCDSESNVSMIETRMVKWMGAKLIDDLDEIIERARDLNAARQQAQRRETGAPAQSQGAG